MPGERRPQAFPPTERVRWRSHFLRVQKKGRKIHADHFVVFVLPQEPPLGSVRLGVTVSTRVGNAVVRNRVKRRLRESFRRHKSMFPHGTDWVFVARAQAAKVTYEEVVAEMTKVCQKYER